MCSENELEIFSNFTSQPFLDLTLEDDTRECFINLPLPAQVPAHGGVQGEPLPEGVHEVHDAVGGVVDAEHELVQLAGGGGGVHQGV